MCRVVREKNGIGALTKIAHSFRSLVIAPSIRWNTPNFPVHELKIWLRALRNFFCSQRVDGIEGSYINAAIVGLGAKGTHPARDVQDLLSYQRIRLKQETAAIFFERATEQHNAIKLQPTFALHL